MSTPPSAHVLTIGGSNKSQFATQDFSITQEFGRQGATGTINLWDNHPVVATLGVIPKPLQSVLLQGSNGTGTVNIFGGVIANPALTWQGPNDNLWELTCRDYTYYTDMSVVSGTFVGQSADSIIKTLVAQANCGITVNHVVPGPIIPKLQVKYIPLSTALKNISLLASGAVLDSTARIGDAVALTAKSAAEYAWFVDENLDLHWFNALGAADSGIVFSDAGFTDTAASTTLHGNYDRDTLKYEWDGTNLRTACLVRGGKFGGGQTDHFVGNGHTRSFPLTFDLDPTVTTALVLSVGIAAKTVAILDLTGVQGSNQITTQYVVVQGDSGQWFLMVGTDATPANGVHMIFTYAYGGTITARADDSVEQAAIGGANHGIFESVVNDGSLLSFATAHLRAQRELSQYSAAQERVTLKTTEDWPGHIFAGQTFIFQSAIVPDAGNNYAVGGLRARYLAERVMIKCMPGQYRVYTVTGTRIS